jgi:hypothetical protein
MYQISESKVWLRPRKPLLSTENIIEVPIKPKPRRTKKRKLVNDENNEYHLYLKNKSIKKIANFEYCEERKVINLINHYNSEIVKCNVRKISIKFIFKNLYSKITNKKLG